MNAGRGRRRPAHRRRAPHDSGRRPVLHDFVRGRARAHLCVHCRTARPEDDAVRHRPRGASSSATTCARSPHATTSRSAATAGTPSSPDRRYRIVRRAFGSVHGPRLHQAWAVRRTRRALERVRSRPGRDLEEPRVHVRREHAVRARGRGRHDLVGHRRSDPRPPLPARGGADRPADQHDAGPRAGVPRRPDARVGRASALGVPDDRRVVRPRARRGRPDHGGGRGRDDSRPPDLHAGRRRLAFLRAALLRAQPAPDTLAPRGPARENRASQGEISPSTFGWHSTPPS